MFSDSGKYFRDPDNYFSQQPILTGLTVHDCTPNAGVPYFHMMMMNRSSNFVATEELFIGK